MSSEQTLGKFFAACPKGLEVLLLEELLQLGADEASSTVGGVHFWGTLETAYKACLWSRLANRVLLPLTQFSVETADELYEGVQTIEWLDHLRTTGSLAIDFTGRTQAINNTHFGALKVKDAIVDQIRSHSGQRPDVDKVAPDIRVNVFLNKGQCQLSIDLSGDSLHRRGYRLKGGEAPLKENLAAALLTRSGWSQMATEKRPFIDPMCGSGTLLVEAGLMAAGIAPGLLRRRFGFENWLQHDNKTWQGLLREARTQRQEALASDAADWPEIHGYDASPKAVSIARENIQRAGLEKFIRVSHRELAQLKPLTHKTDILPGLLLTNPPYGERLSEIPVIVYLYRHLGDALKAHFHHWKVGVFTGNSDLGKAVGIRATKQYKFFNGPIASKLLMFDVEEALFFGANSKSNKTQQSDLSNDATSGQSGAAGQGIEIPPAAEPFANRVRKNLKQIDKWARKADIQCYRIYDADIPEFSVAVDRYGDWVLVQEYAAPASVDQVKAVERLELIMAAIPSVMGVPPNKVVLKQRRRQSGKNQYEKLDDQQRYFEVTEGGVRLLVNLHDYLDTGLFLDHRPIRLKLQQWAKDKRFLNLFCYTGAATIHAAMGGAKSTTSVDMSNTYLEWLRKNIALNGLSEKLHETVQEDCLAWLKAARSQQAGSYDLIFMDPPTFSNSKRMRETLDVQRDHVALITAAVDLLSPGGQLVFSNNLRNFKIDEDALSDLTIENITKQSIDRDYARNKKIHNCWLISRER